MFEFSKLFLRPEKKFTFSLGINNFLSQEANLTKKTDETKTIFLVKTTKSGQIEFLRIKFVYFSNPADVIVKT
jgi:hypothetical protein